MAGQVRVLIEGINTTEGTTGAGFYFDYSSLEEVFLGTTGQSAEMPNPGVQSQFIAKSGGNQFQGEAHIDWYNNSLQGSNLPDVPVPTAFNNSPIREHSNESTVLRHGDQRRRPDHAGQAVVVRHLSHAVQRGPAAEFPVRQDVRHQVVERRRQGHLPDQPEAQDRSAITSGARRSSRTACRQATYTYLDEGPTNRQDSGSWVYKAEWNGTLSDKVYLEARYGDFGYYFPQITNGTEPYFFRDSGRLEITARIRRTRTIAIASSETSRRTYFLDGAMGSHTFKMGAEMLKELQWFGVLQGVGRQHRARLQQRRGEPADLPDSDRDASRRPERQRQWPSHGGNALDQTSLFLNDTWSFGRMTINGGVRWDRYKGWLPEQQQLASTPRSGCDPPAGEDVRREGSIYLEPVRAAHRRGL